MFSFLLLHTPVAYALAVARAVALAPVTGRLSLVACHWSPVTYALAVALAVALAMALALIVN